MVAAKRFPAPVKLSEGVTAWRVEDIRAWMTERKRLEQVDEAAVNRNLREHSQALLETPVKAAPVVAQPQPNARREPPIAKFDTRNHAEIRRAVDQLTTAIVGAFSSLSHKWNAEHRTGGRIDIDPAPYVTIRLAATITGLTEKAIRRKIEEGKWLDGREYRRSPDGGIFISMKGYVAWVEREQH
jgi:hypothetical protein